MMLMHHRASTAMPRREQHAAMATLVLHILQPADQIRDAAHEENAADDECPGTVGKYGQLKTPNRYGKESWNGETYWVVFPE